MTEIRQRYARRVSTAISVQGVGKTFRTRKTAVEALAEVSFSVEAGEVVTLLGPSGCGKTTLLRMIAGLESPSSGAITVNNRQPSDVRSRKQIAFVPQSPALLPWRTVRANARLLLDINKSAHRTLTQSAPSVDDLLDEVGLSAFADAYPQELSGGMQQRVGLVRAFALNAPVLLMDEPFAALDEITRTEMRHMLERLRSRLDATVVFVTHSIAEAAYLSDRVVVMTPLPGRVSTIVAVRLPRPRLASIEDSPEFFTVTTDLRHALQDGVTR